MTQASGALETSDIDLHLLRLEGHISTNLTAGEILFLFEVRMTAAVDAITIRSTEETSLELKKQTKKLYINLPEIQGSS